MWIPSLGAGPEAMTALSLPRPRPHSYWTLGEKSRHRLLPSLGIRAKVSKSHLDLFMRLWFLRSWRWEKIKRQYFLDGLCAAHIFGACAASTNQFFPRTFSDCVNFVKRDGGVAFECGFLDSRFLRTWVSVALLFVAIDLFGSDMCLTTAPAAPTRKIIHCTGIQVLLLLFSSRLMAHQSSCYFLPDGGIDSGVAKTWFKQETGAWWTKS